MTPPRTLSRSEEMRLFAGLAIQPFLATGLAFFAFPTVMLDRSGQTLAGGFPADPTRAAASVAFGAGLIALVVTVLGAFPTAMWLTKRRRVSFGEALLFGLVFGNVPYVLMATAAGGTYGFVGLVHGVAFSSLLGVCGAATFWAIALRPERINDDSTAV